MRTLPIAIMLFFSTLVLDAYAQINVITELHVQEQGNSLRVSGVFSGIYEPIEVMVVYEKDGEPSTSKVLTNVVGAQMADGTIKFAFSDKLPLVVPAKASDYCVTIYVYFNDALLDTCSTSLSD